MQTVANEDDIGPGERKFIEINGTEITLFNIKGRYHAIKNFCPHMEGPIGRGPVGETECGKSTIACPFHGWRFELETGEVSFNSRKRLVTYDVQVIDGEVRVDI